MDDVEKIEDQCPGIAEFRYTWPGQDESFVCIPHSIKLKNVATAIGLHIQLIQLPLDAHKRCRQKVKNG